MMTAPLSAPTFRQRQEAEARLREKYDETLSGCPSLAFLVPSHLDVSYTHAYWQQSVTRADNILAAVRSRDTSRITRVVLAEFHAVLAADPELVCLLENGDDDADFQQVWLHNMVSHVHLLPRDSKSP